MSKGSIGVSVEAFVIAGCGGVDQEETEFVGLSGEFGLSEVLGTGTGAAMHLGFG